MGSVRLTELLNQLRRRVIAIGGMSGLGWGASAAVGLVIIAAWLDLFWELGSGARAGVWLLAGLSVVALFTTALWRSWLASRPSMIARRLDEVAKTGGQVLSGIDLVERAPPLEPNSAALAQLAVERAAQVSATVDPKLAIPARPVRLPFTALATGCAVILLVALMMPRLAWTQLLRLMDPYGDHPPFSLVSFQVEPGDSRIVYGSPLEVRVKAEGPPVDNLQLILKTNAGDEALPMFPRGVNEWSGTVANITTAGHYLVRAERARSKTFRIDLITVPRIEEVRFRITPPAYTNQAAYELSGGAAARGDATNAAAPTGMGENRLQQGLTGLPGTKVTVMVRSNRPLAGGRLDVLAGEQREQTQFQPLESSPNEVTGQFVIRDSGKLQFWITDVEGTDSQQEFSAPITVLSDERPFIRILEPPAVSFATTAVDLPIVLSAEDDFGVSRVQVFRALNDSRAMPLEVPLDRVALRRHITTVNLPMSSYGLTPGDVIKLFARVEDNDPAGAKGFESSVVRIQIISQADFERMVRQREGLEVLVSKYQQAERRMEALAERLAKLEEQLAALPPESELSEQLRQEMEKAADELNQEAAAIKEAAEHLLPYDLDKDLTDELQKLAEALQSASESMRQGSQIPKLSASQASQQTRQAREQMKRNREQFQDEAMAPIENLAAVYPIVEDEARFTELYRRQRELEERLQSLKQTDAEKDPKSKSRMRDLEAEQQQIRTELSNLLDDIEDHAQQLPSNPQLDALKETALEFAAAVRQSGAVETMASCEFSLAEFAGSPAHTSAKEAADILEKFLSKCQGMGGQACEGARTFKPSLSECMQATIDQLLAEAGMGAKTGSGMGEGSGGGYSARRNTMNNVGMYGHLPALGQTARSGFGASRLGGSGKGGSLVNDGSSRPGEFSMPGELRASGGSAAAIPPKYRQRVSEYFETIVDETGGHP